MEARQLAASLGHHPYRYALAGRTTAPNLTGIEPDHVHSGGFGGIAGLTAYCVREGVQAIVDATHPFAAVISEHAVAASTSADIPLLRYTRAPWTPVAADRWVSSRDLEQALGAVATVTGKPCARVLVTTGTRGLETLAGHPQHQFFVRAIETPDCATLGNVQVVRARGPFSLDDELRTLASLNIDALISKNSGGMATEAKLNAARVLSIPVLMVERPSLPECTEAYSLSDALAWVSRQCR